MPSTRNRNKSSKVTQISQIKQMLYIDDEFCLYLSVLKEGFHKHFRIIKPLFTTKVDIVWRYLENTLSEVPQKNLNLSSIYLWNLWNPCEVWFVRFEKLVFKITLNFIKHEKRNLEIHHSDDSRHSDGYSDHLGRNILHGNRLKRKQPLQTGEAV